MDAVRIRITFFLAFDFSVRHCSDGRFSVVHVSVVYSRGGQRSNPNLANTRDQTYRVDSNSSRGNRSSLGKAGPISLGSYETQVRNSACTRSAISLPSHATVSGAVARACS